MSQKSRISSPENAVIQKNQKLNYSHLLLFVNQVIHLGELGCGRNSQQDADI